VKELVLRVEVGGELLGEFPLTAESLTLRLEDVASGQLVSTLVIQPASERSSADAQYRDKTLDLAEPAEPAPAKVTERRPPEIINFQIPPPPEAPQPQHEDTTGSDELEMPTESIAGARPEPDPPAPPPPPPPSLTERPDDSEEPNAGLDRSITHTLTDGAFLFEQLDELRASSPEEAAELLQAVTNELPEGGQRPRAVPVAPDLVEELGRSTDVVLDDESEAETGRHVFPPAPAGVQELHGLRGAGPSIVPTDFAEEEDEAVTVVARQPGEDHRAFRHGSSEPGRVSGGGGEYDELPVPGHGRRQMGDDLSLSLPYDPATHGLSLPLPLGADSSMDDLSLSLSMMGDRTATGGDDPSLSLSLPMPESRVLYQAASDDDLSLPLPEESSPPLDPAQAGEPTATHHAGAFELGALNRPHAVPPRLIDTTAGFERDPSTERLEGAEVWFRRSGEWTPRGALSFGQHVQAFGGMVRCDDQGGLVVLAGPRLGGSATLPSGELQQISSGQQAVHLPPGTSVILWQGEQGLYVRSNVASDGSEPGDGGPVVYRRQPRPRSWKPPRSDLDEDSGS